MTLSTEKYVISLGTYSPEITRLTQFRDIWISDSGPPENNRKTVKMY